MDDQERLVRAVEELLKAHREARVGTAMGLALEILASNPSAPRVGRKQSVHVEVAGQVLDDPDDEGFASLVRRENRRRALIVLTFGLIIVIALLSLLGLLLL